MITVDFEAIEQFLIGKLYEGAAIVADAISDGIEQVEAALNEIMPSE